MIDRLLENQNPLENRNNLDHPRLTLVLNRRPGNRAAILRSEIHRHGSHCGKLLGVVTLPVFRPADTAIPVTTGAVGGPTNDGSFSLDHRGCCGQRRPETEPHPETQPTSRPAANGSIRTFGET